MKSKTSTLWISAFVLVAAASMLVTANAQAQGAVAATLDKVTVSTDAAKRTLTKMQLNAEAARAIVDACVQFGKASNTSYSVFVLAPNGDIIDAHIMDGQLPIGVETALLKAKTALYARTPSSAVAQRFNTMDQRVIRLQLGQSSGLAYYFVGGGLPIVVQDQLIGAIGVGGGNMDEMCAYTALTKVLGPQPPLPTAQPAAAPAQGQRGGRGQ
jgi:glc operon protein GlcG